VSLECMACQLTAGERELAGGRIFQTDHWVVETASGRSRGALILKPLRHIVALADMSDAEAAELGPLMQRRAPSSGLDRCRPGVTHACVTRGVEARSHPLRLAALVECASVPIPGAVLRYKWRCSRKRAPLTPMPSNRSAPAHDPRSRWRAAAERRVVGA